MISPKKGIYIPPSVRRYSLPTADSQLNVDASCPGIALTLTRFGVPASAGWRGFPVRTTGRVSSSYCLVSSFIEQFRGDELGHCEEIWIYNRLRRVIDGSPNSGSCSFMVRQACRTWSAGMSPPQVYLIPSVTDRRRDLQLSGATCISIGDIGH